MPGLDLHPERKLERPPKGAVYAPRWSRIAHQAFFLLLFLLSLYAMTDGASGGSR